MPLLFKNYDSLDNNGLFPDKSVYNFVLHFRAMCTIVYSEAGEATDPNVPILSNHHVTNNNINTNQQIQ